MRRSYPLPIRRSASSTNGLSRSSSVPGLNARPNSPTRRRPFAVSSSYVRRKWASFDLEDALEDRHVDVRTLGPVHERAQVLRQARAAEAEARRQVGLADVQLAVGLEDLHQLVRVDAELDAEGADLVGEADLERVERVVDVLRGLGDADRNAEDRSAKSPYISAIGSPLAASSSPDHGLLGAVEVGDAAALAQVLRVDGDAEVAARLAGPSSRSSAGMTVPSVVPGSTVLRTTTVCRRSVLGSAAPDVLADALERAEVDRPLRAGRRADADERDVGRPDRLGRVLGRPQSTRLGRLGDRLGQAGLEDGRLAVVDRRDLARVDVHSDDVDGHASRGSPPKRRPRSPARRR